MYRRRMSDGKQGSFPALCIECSCRNVIVISVPGDAVGLSALVDCPVDLGIAEHEHRCFHISYSRLVLAHPNVAVLGLRLLVQRFG
jgi:hypothetical protein